MTVRAGNDALLPPVGRELRRAVERWPVEDRPALELLDPADDGVATVRCGTARHAIAVGADRLHLRDHDALAEVSLAAFGSAPPACLVYALAWDDAFIGSAFFRTWAASERPHPAALAHRRHDWNENTWETWPDDPAAASVLFSPPLQDALALRVARAWAVSPTIEQARLLSLAVRVRARARFVESIAALDAHPKPDALVPLRIDVRLEGDGGRMSGRLARSGSGVDLRLGIEWLWAVWGEGVSVTGGEFVLARSEGRPRTVQWRPAGGADRLHLPVVDG